MNLVFSHPHFQSLTDSLLCEQLLAFFQTKMPEIDLHLVRDLSFISQLAHYKGGMQARFVEQLSADTFYMHFEYRWHIFNSCMDMDEIGDFKDKVKFALDTKGQITLDLTAFAALSTADDL